MVPRDFDMDSPNPFRSSDIVSLVPVHKVKTGHEILKAFFFYSIESQKLLECAHIL